MLRASYTYVAKQDDPGGTGVGTHVTEPDAPRPIEELRDLVDRFRAMATDREGRLPPGPDGDHAWLTVRGHRLALFAYFGKRTIVFELYGPTNVDNEDEFDPYDGTGLSGELDTDTLKAALELLDDGRSPRELLRERAKSCAVVVD